MLRRRCSGIFKIEDNTDKARWIKSSKTANFLKKGKENENIYK
jgi:hypothetical protein